MNLTSKHSDNRSSGNQQSNQSQSKNYQQNQSGRSDSSRSPYANENQSSLSASDSIEEILQVVKGYAESATEFVKKRPVTILLGAVAIGAAVALVGTSLRSSKKWSDEHAK